jgi:DNA-directed RNA polymerase specialized sigma24 family protein
MKASTKTIDDPILTDAIPAQGPRRKWVLTKEAFDKLLDSLAEDRESAGERYLEIRSNLIRFFQWRGCHSPEDHADETINRIAKRVSECEEIRTPSSYYLGVARMVLLEVNKARIKEQQFFGEISSSLIASVPPEESEERINCLRDCLQRLSAENRELIIQYYSGEKRDKIEIRRQLSRRLGIPVNTLRMRALRIREQLQRYVESHQEHNATKIIKPPLSAPTSGSYVINNQATRSDISRARDRTEPPRCLQY